VTTSDCFSLNILQILQKIDIFPNKNPCTIQTLIFVVTVALKFAPKKKASIGK
jgi:hypothetical protein